MRVVVAHEWLVRYAGSERCVLELVREFPGSRLMATLVAPERVPVELAGAEPSWLQRVPGAVDHHEWVVPLMPLAWRTRPPVDDADLVISSSHACAKGVRVAAGVPHLCYCHTPMRYAWQFSSEAARFPRVLRLPSRAAMPLLRRWDRGTASRVTKFLANSTAVADRVRRFYGRTADVVHPPVRTDYFTPGGERGFEFLFVGRLVAYKRPDVAVEAFRGTPHRLVVVGDGPMLRRLRAQAPPNVVFAGSVDDATLRTLYRSARALFFPGVEDFGISIAEAQACGTPVLALDAGGARDIVEHGRTGWLMPSADLGVLREALEHAATTDLDPREIQARARRFSSQRFRREMRAAAEGLTGSRREARVDSVAG